MKNACSLKPVVVQRITSYPTPEDAAMGILSGNTPQPASMWVAVGVNTNEVVAQAPEKAKLLEMVASKRYTVRKVINDWN